MRPSRTREATSAAIVAATVFDGARGSNVSSIVVVVDAVVVAAAADVSTLFSGAVTRGNDVNEAGGDEAADAGDDGTTVNTGPNAELGGVP